MVHFLTKVTPPFSICWLRPCINDFITYNSKIALVNQLTGEPIHQGKGPRVAAGTSAIGKCVFHKASSCCLRSLHTWCTRLMDVPFAFFGVPGFPVGCPGCHDHPAITINLNRDTIFFWWATLSSATSLLAIGGIGHGLPSFQSMAAGKLKVSCNITFGHVEEILHQQDESWQAKSYHIVSEMAWHERASAAVVAKKEHISSLAALL